MTADQHRDQSDGQSSQVAQNGLKSILRHETGQTPSSEPSRITDPSVTFGAVTQPYSVREMSYESAKFILKGGKDATGVFPPLQSAVAGLLAFVDRVDSMTDVDTHFAGLVSRIDQISTVFRSVRAGYLCSNEELQRWAADLAKRIEMYRVIITSKRQRSILARFLSVDGDQQQIETTWRDLDGVIRDFMMSATGSIASNMDKLVKEQSYKLLSIAPGTGYEAQNVLSFAGETRDALLDEMVNWAKKNDGPSILWLSGAPLVGKTCIASALCQRLHSQRLLGASFFCSQSTEERRDASRIIPTLARTLAGSATRLSTHLHDIQQHDTAFSDSSESTALHTLTHARFRYASRLANALQGDWDAANFTPSHQFRVLLSDPAAASFIEPSLPPCIFIIDGIDECAGAHSFMHTLVGSILNCAQSAKLKFVITSRSNEQINSALLLPCERRQEIRLLHVAEAEDIVDTRERLCRLSSDRVCQDILEPLSELHALARQANIDSTFSSIAFRYLGQYPDDLLNQLRLVANTIDICSKVTSLCGLFDLVLKDSLASLRRNGRPAIAFATIHFSRVKTYLVGCDWSLFTSHLAPELAFEPSEINSSLDKWSMSESVDTDAKCLRKYLNESRSAVCQAWRCRNRELHLYALRCCLKVMETSLRFNVCGARTSYLSNEQQKLKDNIPGHVTYACAAWIEHAALAAPEEDVLRWASEVLRERFLFWLEVVSVVKGVDTASSLLQKLYHFCLEHSTYNSPNAAIRTLADLTRRARHFVLSTHDVIGVSAPHIYLSSLGFDPLASKSIYTLHHQYAQTISVRGPCDSEISSLIGAQGHTDCVLSVAFSCDGQRLASASDDKTICLWDALTGAQIGQPLQGHDDCVWSVAFSPDGQRLASGSYDKTICLWNTRTGSRIGQPLRGHTDWIQSVAFSPDGQQLASASHDKTIRLWDARTGAQMGKALRGHARWVQSVAFYPDGRKLVSASSDKTVRLWDAQTGLQIGQPLQGHTDWIWSVAVSPNGQWLASASSDKTIRLWDARTRADICQPLRGHTERVWSVVFSPDSQLLASSSDDTTIRLWDARTGAQIGNPIFCHIDTVQSIAFSPASQMIAFASRDNIVRTCTIEGRDTSNNLKDGQLIPLWPRNRGAGAPRSTRLGDNGIGIVPGLDVSQAGRSKSNGNNPTSVHEYPMLKMAFSPFAEHHGSLGALLKPDSSINPQYIFVMDDDGWIRGPQNELILWIPPQYKRRLWWRSRTNAIAGKLPVYLDLSRFVHGEDWMQCYTGLAEDGRQSDTKPSGQMQHAENS